MLTSSMHTKDPLVPSLSMVVPNLKLTIVGRVAAITPSIMVALPYYGSNVYLSITGDLAHINRNSTKRVSNVAPSN